jgi:hypothetical protein
MIRFKQNAGISPLNGGVKKTVKPSCIFHRFLLIDRLFLV